MGLFHQFIPISPATATNIQNYMAVNGLDPKSFAALAGLDPNTIKRITTDPRCEIRSDTRQKLTRALGCTWNQLSDPDLFLSIPIPASVAVSASSAPSAVQSVAVLGDLQPSIEPAVSAPSAPPSAAVHCQLSIIHYPFSILTCRRAPLALWLLNSLRAWRECFTWRAALENLSDWIRAAFSPRPPRLTQARLTPLQTYLTVWHDGESDQEAPHA